MEARLVMLTPKPGQLHDLAGFWDDSVVAEITAQEGSVGFFVLPDETNGRVVLLSLWDTNENADATGPTVKRHMEAVADRLAGPPDVNRVAVAMANCAPLGR